MQLLFTFNTDMSGAVMIGFTVNTIVSGAVMLWFTVNAVMSGAVMIIVQSTQSCTMQLSYS